MVACQNNGFDCVVALACFGNAGAVVDYGVDHHRREDDVVCDFVLSFLLLAYVAGVPGIAP